jgi:hypothetical protein
MIKIASQKSGDKINFKDFVDFFYKIDWMQAVMKFVINDWANNC